MADQVLITDEAAVKTIEKYAEQKEISKAEAGARLIATAKGRINAVRKFAAKSAADRPAKPKAAKPAKPAKDGAAAPKRRGRPPGSKNKPKAATPETAPVSIATVAPTTAL